MMLNISVSNPSDCRQCPGNQDRLSGVSFVQRQRRCAHKTYMPRVKRWREKVVTNTKAALSM